MEFVKHNFRLEYLEGEEKPSVTFVANSREELQENLKVAVSILMEKIYPIDHVAELERLMAEVDARDD